MSDTSGPQDRGREPRAGGENFRWPEPPGQKQRAPGPIRPGGSSGNARPAGDKGTIYRAGSLSGEAGKAGNSGARNNGTQTVLTSNQSKKLKRKDSPPTDWRVWLKRLVKYGTLSFFAMVLFGVVVFIFAYNMMDLPDENSIAKGQQTTLYYSNGKEIGSFGMKRTRVPLSDIPMTTRNAVLAAEDPTFYQNQGVSPKGIGRALYNNLKGGPQQGGSTITQQYVKNVYTQSERSYKRKAKEFIYALKIDRQMEKYEILENYLNTIFWGRGSWGVEEAAKTYFGVPAKQLNTSQSALLAVMIRSPGNKYNPNRKPNESGEEYQQRQANLRWAWNDVLNKMVANGMLTQAERDAQKFPKVNPQKEDQSESPDQSFIMKTAREELVAAGISEADLYRSGLKIYTTIDQDMQSVAVSTMKDRYESIKDKGVHAALISIDPRDGSVLSMYAGKEFEKKGIAQSNDATSSQKMMGSTFKAFTLMTALEQGKSLSDVEYNGDSPIKVPRVGPQGGVDEINNAGDGPNRSYGKVSLLTATSRSINTAFVDAAIKIGPDKIKDTVVRSGMDLYRFADGPNGKLPAVPAITLGTAAIAPVDLASGFATIASGGKRVDILTASGKRNHWHIVKYVRNDTGVVYAPKVNLVAAFDPQHAADATLALEGVVLSPNGTGAAARPFANIGADGRPRRPVAAKTGTSQNARSAWFVGFTPNIVTAVNFWREAEDGSEITLDGVDGIKPFYGGKLPARVWTDFMTTSYEKSKMLQDANPYFMDPSPYLTEGQNAGTPVDPRPLPSEDTPSTSGPTLPSISASSNLTPSVPGSSSSVSSSSSVTQSPSASSSQSVSPKPSPTPIIPPGRRNDGG